MTSRTDSAEGVEKLDAASLGRPLLEIETNDALRSKNVSFYEVPAEAKFIGKQVFDGNSHLKAIDIPRRGIVRIKEWAFDSCRRLEKIEIPETTRVIERRAFIFCHGLEEVRMYPKGLLEIHESAFSDCKALTEVVLPSTLRELGEGAFQDCDRLKRVTFPEMNLKTIQQATFSCCGLLSITIPCGVELIEEEAFANCKDLRSITIESSPKRPALMIRKDAFRNCVALRHIQLPDGTAVDIPSRGRAEFIQEEFRKFRKRMKRYPFLHALRKIDETSTENPSTGADLENASSRAYRTRNISRLRYLMCCIVRYI